VTKELLKGPHVLRVSIHGVDEETYRGTMGLRYNVAVRNAKRYIAEGCNVEIWGAGKPRRPELGTDYNFDKKVFLKQWPGAHYFTYHDRAGSIHRNHINANVQRKPPKCHRIFNWMHVLWDGAVILCCMDYHKETVLGNLGQMGVKRLLRYRKPMDICKRCISPGG